MKTPAPARDGATSSSARDVFATLRVALSVDTPLTIAEIARRLQISGNKAYRAVTTLEHAEYLQRSSATGGFAIGAAAERLVHAAFQRLAIRPALVPYLRQIATASEATVALILRIGWYGVRIANIEGAGEVVARVSRLGSATLLHESAAGLAILGCVSPQERARFAAFVAVHRSPIAGFETALQRKIKGVAANGFARFEGAQLRAIGLPLRDAAGDVTAAILIEASNTRAIPLDRDPHLGNWLHAAAQAENVLKAAPGKYANPYAHLDPDTVVFG